MVLGNGLSFTPIIQAAYVHEFAPQRTQFGTLASLPGSTFLVNGARPDSNAAQVKVGGELALGPNSALFANFDGEFAGHDQFYGGKGGLRYTW
jgi:outer membrane autotransporter protein